MNATVNEPGCSSQLNSTAEKVRQTFAYCLILVLFLVGNSCLGIIVYRTQTMRKPINYFVTNMAMSDLLYSIFFFPHKIALLYKGQSWLVGSGFGQAMCKLLPFLSDTSTIVFVQSLILIAVDRFGAVLFPLRSPLITSRLCPFFILATWVIAMAIAIAIFICPQTGRIQRGANLQNTLERDFWRLLVACKLLLGKIHCIHLPADCLVGDAVLQDFCQTQITSASRWAVDQRRGTTHQKKQQRAKDGHCYCFRLCDMRGAFHCHCLAPSVCMDPFNSL